MGNRYHILFTFLRPVGGKDNYRHVFNILKISRHLYNISTLKMSNILIEIVDDIRIGNNIDSNSEVVGKGNK